MADLRTPKWSELVFKALSTAIIPVLGYAFILHATIAVQEEKLATQAAAVHALKEEVKKIGDNKISLVRLEGKVEAANGKLDDIKAALAKL